MEQYPVPQFIEREARITTFITFRQLIYLLIAGGICFPLFFVLPFFIFIFVTIFLIGGAFSLAFIKIQGIPLTTVLLNSLGFLKSSKNYVWKKKESRYPFKVIEKIELKKIEEQKTALKVYESKLKKIGTKIEMKTK